MLAWDRPIEFSNSKFVKGLDESEQSSPFVCAVCVKVHEKASIAVKTEYADCKTVANHVIIQEISKTSNTSSVPKVLTICGQYGNTTAERVEVIDTSNIAVRLVVRDPTVVNKFLFWFYVQSPTKLEHIPLSDTKGTTNLKDQIGPE